MSASKSAFVTNPPALDLIVAGQSVTAKAREFSTGSVGFNLNGKVTLADGTRLQITGNAIAIGSKDWPK
jgi:hypothetical protein